MPIIFFGTLSATPNSGATGDTIQIDNTGAGFRGTMIARFGGSGGTSADNIAIAVFGNGQQRITCDVPAGLAAGATTIYLENPDGENGTIVFTVTGAVPSGALFFNFVTAANCK